MYDDDQEEEEEEDDEPGIENEYYEAKAMIEEDVDAAIEGFEKVVKMEEEKGEWGFKALKRLVKLYFGKDNRKKTIESFKKFMEYTKNAVSANPSEKGLNSVLDVVGAGKDLSLTEEAYNVALASLKKFNNERVWFRTNLKFGKLLYDNNEFNKLAKVLKELRASCQTETGEDDQKKGSQLVDIYALEIQMYTETKKQQNSQRNLPQSP